MTLSNGLAPTPPMGWNSYDFYGGAVTEEEVRANAHYMAAHLKHVGWEYIVIDIAWHSPQRSAVGGGYVFDEYGRLQPHVGRFPSSRDGAGYKPLADHVHSLGLKFGIHVMPGVCQAAMDAGCKVLGTSTPVADIAIPDEFNQLWRDALHYIRPDHPDGQRYYDSLMEQYAAWEVDFIKADGPGFPYRNEEVRMLDTARQRAGRPMVLSVSSGCTQYSAHMKHRQRHCEMSRISEDFWDRWPQLETMFDNFRAWRGHTGPGHWADGDMLPLGRVGRDHGKENGPERYTRFNEHEQRTLMSLFCIAQSPLMLGNELPGNTAADLALISNAEVLEVNQRGRDGRELFRDCHHSAVIWLCDMPGDGDWVLGVFNFNPARARTIPIAWSETGLPARCTIRDLWAGRDLGAPGETWTVEVPPHGAGLYRVRVAR